MKPRALLIQPPVYDFALYDLFHQPYGLLRIGRWLEEAGYLVELADCLDPVPPRKSRFGDGKFTRTVVAKPDPVQSVPRQFGRYGRPEDEIRSCFARARPDIALMTTGMTYWYPGVAEVARLLSQTCSGIPVVAGGIYASLMPAHCQSVLGDGLVVAGSTEDCLRDALSGAGLPVPHTRLPSMPSAGLRTGRLLRSAAIRLNEGCPYRCSYCASGRIAPHFGPGNPSGLVHHVAELNQAG